MKHKGIGVLAPLALATVAALGFGQVAQAAPAVQGETQLVTVDQYGELYHTIRHADGSWQKMGVIPGYGQVNALASAMVGGEENVIVEFQTGTQKVPDIQAARLVRHADGTWNFNASLPEIPMNPGALSLVNVNGRLNLVSLTSTGPMVAELGADGTWSAFSNVPGPGHMRSVAAVANGSSLRVVELYGDGRTVGVVDRTATGWSTINTTLANTDDRNVDTQVAAAQIGDTLQVGVVLDSATDTQAVPWIDHATMDKSGNWSGFAGLPTVWGRAFQVSMTAANGEMQLAYTTETGALYHTIRHADGTWQEPGFVPEVTGGGSVTGPVTIAGE